MDQACAVEPELRQNVDSLIASHEQAASFMEAPAFEAATELLTDDRLGSVVGRRIGPYKVISEIGHGGMGMVCLAVRADEQYQKRVALKLVKLGLDAEFIVRRFRQERQILASLDHPNIAKLLGNDHPEVAWTLYNYAYMMYLKGDYAAAARLSREVLRLRGKTLPDSHTMIASALQVLGRSLAGQGDPKSAEPLLRESLLLRQKAMPAGHWLSASSESVLGDCLTRLRRFREAEPLLLNSYAKLKANLGERHDRTREALERIINLYDVWRKPTKAAEYRARLPQTR